MAKFKILYEHEFKKDNWKLLIPKSQKPKVQKTVCVNIFGQQLRILGNAPFR